MPTGWITNSRWLFLRRQVWHLRLQSLVYVNCPGRGTGKLYLAYKESGIDSIAEFIGARSSLFSQVYYHKTNRAFATMLSTLCEIMQSKDPQNVIIADVTDRIVDHSDESFIDALEGVLFGVQ